MEVQGSDNIDETVNISLKQLREQKEATISKWEASGLLEGLVGYDDSKNIAQLFGCCPSYIINENEEENKD